MATPNETDAFASIALRRLNIAPPPFYCWLPSLYSRRRLNEWRSLRRAAEAIISVSCLRSPAKLPRSGPSPQEDREQFTPGAAADPFSQREWEALVTRTRPVPAGLSASRWVVSGRTRWEWSRPARRCRRERASPDAERRIPRSWWRSVSGGVCCSWTGFGTARAPTRHRSGIL